MRPVQELYLWGRKVSVAKRLIFPVAFEKFFLDLKASSRTVFPLGEKYYVNGIMEIKDEEKHLTFFVCQTIMNKSIRETDGQE